MTGALPGARPSPNIWHHTATYEVENRATDPDGRLWSAMASLADWSGRDVLDLGCGTGFHLPRFAADARTVLGVEPHPDLLALARRRTRALANVSVVAGMAQAIPLPDASVDVVHARWAYFFGPGCEPGLAELSRVVRRGGVALVIDNDPTTSTFGEVVPARLSRPRPGRGRAVLVDAWLDPDPVDMGWRFRPGPTWRPWCGSSSTPPSPTRARRARGTRGRLRGQSLVTRLLISHLWSRGADPGSHAGTDRRLPERPHHGVARLSG